MTLPVVYKSMIIMAIEMIRDGVPRDKAVCAARHRLKRVASEKPE